MNVHIKTSEEIQVMREGAKILKLAHDAVRGVAKEGVSLLELDKVAEKIIRSAGAVPSFKGFQGFPATLCTMINSEVVHGIPDHRKLKKGDLLSIDCGVKYKGFHTDAAFSIIVGGDAQNPVRAKFSRCVRSALLAGCQAARAGATIGDIGYAIEQVVRKGGYSICKEYTGHGFGRELHEDPHVYNYGRRGEGDKLIAGMTIAIEPIVTSGSPRVRTLADGWTVVTLDGRDACQWEHCGVVTEDGFEIFV
ncbi:type I methionyl aminopeptidase [Candidatus Gracilibacteria bacterium]|nr:type I methionyl aminopeptidase [Candidatus Gracilibacteria bacterium]